MPRKTPAPRQSAEPCEFPIRQVARILKEESARWREPIVTRLARAGRDPFRVLVSTILSLRTKDECTAAASERLFKLARTPRAMMELGQATIARTIYPVGFYNTKARNIVKVCHVLTDRYAGRVPDTLENLLALDGVGRKTANLVLTQGFGKPGICVDTHVHRITNRWGYVATRTPDETETVLRQILPRRYWIPINDWLVAYGQNLCVPVSPWCSRCRIRPWCARAGVERSR